MKVESIVSVSIKYTQQAHSIVVPTCKYVRMRLETEQDELSICIYIFSFARILLCHSIVFDCRGGNIFKPHESHTPCQSTLFRTHTFSLCRDISQLELQPNTRFVISAVWLLLLLLRFLLQRICSVEYWIRIESFSLWSIDSETSYTTKRKRSISSYVAKRSAVECLCAFVNVSEISTRCLSVGWFSNKKIAIEIHHRVTIKWFKSFKWLCIFNFLFGGFVSSLVFV